MDGTMWIYFKGIQEYGKYNKLSEFYYSFKLDDMREDFVWGYVK
jgi:hypothetical protein